MSFLAPIAQANLTCSLLDFTRDKFPSITKVNSTGLLTESMLKSLGLAWSVILRPQKDLCLKLQSWMVHGLSLEAIKVPLPPRMSLSYGEGIKTLWDLRE